MEATKSGDFDIAGPRINCTPQIFNIMINKRTVFILGAGASMPYGFSSGAELREILCAPITNIRSNRTVDWISSVSKVGINEDTSKRFADAFLRSGTASIDSFLSRRLTEFGEIGKSAIAAILCAQEEPTALLRTDTQDDWYGYLWNALVAGVHMRNELASNQVRFVTFNYDRSLEYFLMQSCKETFALSDETAKKALEPIKIIHVYGQLGELDQVCTSRARPYTTRIGADELSVAANGIKIIPESRDDAPEFAEVREMFEWAEQICFLGFGFDPLNVLRLNLESVCAPRRIAGKALSLVASTYLKTSAEKEAIQRSIPSSNSWWTMFDQKNLMTIRESGVLL